MLRPSLLLAGALLLSACSGPADKDAVVKDPECPDCNVVLLSIDTLRADHLGLYGHSRPTSPTLDELAGESVVFDNFFNNGGTTLPVHMSMMTSLQPFAHMVLPSAKRRLEDERVTIAERLSEAGWATAAFTDSGWVRGEFGFDQGFETFDDSGGRLEAILPKALDWISARDSRPFFLFLHTYDVHSEWNELPYECPGEMQFTFQPEEELRYQSCADDVCASEKLAAMNRRLWTEPDLRGRLMAAGIHEELARLYDGCILYVDGKVRELIDHLRAEGRWEKTIFIVTSDHGEGFMEHNMLLHISPWEEVLRIPLIIRFPQSRATQETRQGAGQRVDHIGTTIDIAPTILEALGLEPEETFRGVSLMPAIRNDEPVRDHFSVQNSARTAQWKYLELGKMQMVYDIASDPGELDNLAESQPNRLRQMQQLAARLSAQDRKAYQDFIAGVEAGEEVVLDEKVKEELRSLGYVQ